MLSLIEKIFNYFMYGITHQNIPKLRQFSMPKQDKEKAKMWYFAFLDVARFARLKQAGNPLLEFTQIIADNRHKLWKLVAAKCGNAIDFFS